MPYNITLTNGTNLTTIADGTTNTSDTSLTLIGKNFTGYGQFFNENFVELLENFASSTQPANALQGQLWWDTTNLSLKIRSGSSWKSVSGSTVTSVAPSSPGSGDFWWDTANGQLKIWNGSAWIVIGPSYTATQGQTGVVANAVFDISSNSHIILEFYVSNILIAVLSKDAPFTVTSLTGFTTINPGFNLSTVGSPQFTGNVTNSLSLGGVSYANYLRSDINGSLNGTLSVTGDFAIGPANNFVANVSGSTVNLSSVTTGRDLNLLVNTGSGPITLLSLNGTTGYISVATPAPFDNSTRISTTSYVDNALLAAPYLLRGGANGSNDITGNIVPAFTGNISFGSVAVPFDNIYSTTFTGIATDSYKLGTQLASKYARNDITSNFAANVSVSGNLIVGSSADFVIGKNTTLNLTSTVSDKSLALQVNDGGVIKTGLTVVGTTSDIVVESATDATSSTTGALTVVGGIGVAKKLYVGSAVDTTSSTTGALVVTGGVGIGQKLYVGSTTDSSSSTTGALIVDGGAGIAKKLYVGSAAVSTSYTTGAVVVTGGVGIGGALQVGGDITAYATSDIRLKKNIVNIPNALDKIVLINGVTFNWNELSDKSLDVSEVGVIAQEIQAVLPEIVSSRDNGYLAVKYEKLVPLLIEAIKELKTEVDILKGNK